MRAASQPAAHWLDASKRKIPPVAALLSVAVPLIVAVIAGFFGCLQLRDTLTFDNRVSNTVALQAKLLKLALDEETGIRGFAVTHDRIFLEPYVEARPQMTAAWRELSIGASGLRLDNERQDVDALSRLQRLWLTTVAQPLADGRLSGNLAKAVEIRGKVIIDEYRNVNRSLATAIARCLSAHRKSYSRQLWHISILIVVSLIMCAIGIALAARKLMHGERVESGLRRRQPLYEQYRAWSMSFQRALLPPRLPIIAGCRFDAVYEPGKSDEQVGGDWYDAVRLIDGRVLISIGDVAGSGHQAALVMGVVRQIMRGIAQLHADPALMLDAADRALRLEHPDVFVTAWVGIVDLVTRTLSYASAGHPPALLALTDGTVSELSDRALPLGLRQGHQDSVTTIALREGSTLVLYTDGLTEADRNVVAGDVLVQAAVAKVAATPWRRPAREIQHHVLAKAAMDDVAILVARFNFAETEQHIRRLSFDVHDAKAARRARTSLVSALSGRGFPPAQKAHGELVLAELIANVLRHAAGPVEVVIDCSGRQTVLHVLDRGCGFRHISRLPSDPYAESGRGMFLIAQLTDDLTVSQRRGGGSHARAVLIGHLHRSLQREDIRTGGSLTAQAADASTSCVVAA